MTDLLSGLPAPLFVAGLFAFAMARGVFYYAIGYATRGGAESRWAARAERLAGPVMQRAEDFLQRVGPVGITLAYPFYGFSAASQIVSGAIAMRWLPFGFFLALAALPWATLQVVLGLAALKALANGFAPYVLVAALIYFVVSWFTRRA